MKRVEIFSFGVRWGLYPGVPAKDELQFVVDLRGMMDDPGSVLPNKTGTDPEISNYILAQTGVPEWFEWEKALMRQRIKELTGSSFTGLTVYYMCHGGCQRSVAIAEEIASWLKAEYGTYHTVEVEHLTMYQTLAAKAVAKEAPPVP